MIRHLVNCWLFDFRRADGISLSIDYFIWYRNINWLKVITDISKSGEFWTHYHLLFSHEKVGNFINYRFSGTQLSSLLLFLAPLDGPLFRRPKVFEYFCILSSLTASYITMEKFFELVLCAIQATKTETKKLLMLLTDETGQSEPLRHFSL